MTRLITLFSLVALFSCQASQYGREIKEPFSGSKYESNARFFRAVGKGSSQMDQIATSKAELTARQGIAQQVNTTIQVVSDQYSQDVGVQLTSEVMERFESLVREITNTTIADLRELDRKKYLAESGLYTVYVAYEVKKAAMYRHLKKQNRLSQRWDEKDKQELDLLLDAAIEEAEASAE
ncbi:MAG: hypothetical protein ACPGYK_08035 [Flavobacteriales bacterium]